MLLLFNRYSTAFLGFLMLAVFLLVSWFSIDSYRRFAMHQSSLSVQSVQSTANEISHMISFLRRSVSLFGEQEHALLARLAATPDDNEAYKRLHKKVQRYFPNHFTFTIANMAGAPLLKQSDPMLNLRCRRDLKTFANQQAAPQIYMHKFSTQSEYHFDVMTRHTPGNARPALFFVSFHLDNLARLMSHGRVAGHQMLLAERGVSDGFEEGTDFGSARIFRADESKVALYTGQLDVGEVLSRSKIAGTNWSIIDQVHPALFRGEMTSLAAKGATITLLFLGFGAGLMSLLRREVDTTGRTRKTLFGIEADRRRIAMDMHDQVLSDLTHLARQCSTMRESIDEPGKIKTHLDRSEVTLEEISAAIRAIIDDLHPAALDILGLEVSLRDYLENKLQGFDHPEFALSARSFSETRLSDVQRLNLYRITLEIVHNIIRHTKASRCRIDLVMDRARLCLTIEDNGRGFVPRRHYKIESRGLANINTRARLIGAHIKWGKPKTNAGGTRFELEMPLQGADQRDGVEVGVDQ